MLIKIGYKDENNTNFFILPEILANLTNLFSNEMPNVKLMTDVNSECTVIKFNCFKEVFPDVIGCLFKQLEILMEKRSELFRNILIVTDRPNVC